MSDQHIEWIKALKPGDLVQDCRYRNIKIKTIDHEYGPDFRNPINYILFKWLSYKPFWWFTGWFDDRLRSRYIPLFSRLYDAQIELEDGSCCSAYHCCDKPA